MGQRWDVTDYAWWQTGQWISVEIGGLLRALAFAFELIHCSSVYLRHGGVVLRSVQ